MRVQQATVLPVMRDPGDRRRGLFLPAYVLDQARQHGCLTPPRLPGPQLPRPGRGKPVDHGHEISRRHHFPYARPPRHGIGDHSGGLVEQGDRPLGTPPLGRVVERLPGMLGQRVDTVIDQKIADSDRGPPGEPQRERPAVILAAQVGQPGIALQSRHESLVESHHSVACPPR
jgi:hypothetical protein